MIMKNQLLNLKMIALMCLMMVLGGAKVWAADKITDVANIVSGGKYYIGATTSNGDDWYLKIDGTSKASGIKGVATKSISEGAIFVIEKNGNSWNLKFDGTNNYLALNSTNAKLDVVSTAKAFTFANKKGLIYMTSKVGSTDRALKRNGDASNFNFGSYKTSYTDGFDVWLMPATPAKTLTSLAITGTPTKTTYNVGEEFDPTGLVVTGTYEDNTTATITNGITWTKNPETMSLGNTSCTVTASVGEVKSEPFVVNGLNVVKAIVFDFTANPNAWGIKPLGKNGKTGSNVIAGKTLEVDGVVMTATNGDRYGTCIYQSGTNTPNLRIYTGGGSITLSAPEGKNLSEILFDIEQKDAGTLTTTEASWSSPTWTGNAHEVTFKCTDNIRINTISIKLVSVTPEKTSETLNFKATDGTSYYATFSSDKDVVFTNDVTVYGVSVDGGKISTNAFTQDFYEVTDATVGEGTGIVENGHYVPANTGVLVEALANNSTSYYFPKTTQSVECPENMLKPAPANGGVFKATDGYKYYKLAYGDWTDKTQLGFYWGAPEGGKFFVKAGTAYLAVSAGENAAKGFTLNGEATGIEGVNANVENAKAIYNLNGQRVASMAKPGLYIVNGKKVVRK